MKRPKMSYTALAALVVGWSTYAYAASTEDKPMLRLHAAAVDVGGHTLDGGKPATTSLLEIGIERFTTDAEAARLAAVLAEKGPDALMRQLQRTERVGYIRTPGSLGWDLHYARMYQLPDGSKRIVFASDRPMNFYELWSRPRSVDYQYLVGEVRLGPDGKGQGTLVPAARVDYDEDTKTIEIENYAAQPVRLVDVRVET